MLSVFRKHGMQLGIFLKEQIDMLVHITARYQVQPQAVDKCVRAVQQLIDYVYSQ